MRDGQSGLLGDVLELRDRGQRELRLRRSRRALRDDREQGDAQGEPEVHGFGVPKLYKRQKRLRLAHPDSYCLGSGQFEILRARSLAPLVKTRGFGMTPFK